MVVLGAGVAGLATALLLARDGHDVTIVERDELPVGEPLDSVGWTRRGIPHFLHPHTFVPRGRYELRENLPDVFDALLRAGAEDADVRRKLPGTPGPGDEALAYLAVRRPLIEWGLRAAVRADPRIDVRERAHVDGLVADGGRVCGVTVDGVRLDAGLVVDALGRRSPVRGWAGLPEPETSDCGVVYYSRYYRQRDGFDLPDGAFILSPRGDLGYFGFATFPGDNRTFNVVLAVPPGVPEWRAVKDEPAFEAAVAAIPALRAWVDPAGVVPITDVLAMAGLRNIRPGYDGTPPGLVPVGDALGATDPMLAHGLAFSLIHAAALAAALRAHSDVADAGAAYAAAVVPELRERYGFATALDEQRLRLWLGRPVTLAPDGDYELFTLVAGGAGALADPDVFRTHVRRIGLLDPLVVLDDDQAMRERLAAVLRAPRPPAGPPRDEMAAIVAAAAAGSRTPRAGV